MNFDRFGTATSRSPIKIPEHWIEQRLAQTTPEISLEAIDQLEAEHASLVENQHICGGFPLAISYFTAGLGQIATKTETDVPATELLESLVADFRNGVTIERREKWVTDDGQAKVRVIGARWVAVLRPTTGDRTQRTLAILESVQKLPVPLGRPAFSPKFVQFFPIGNAMDEVPCDPRELESWYLESRAAREVANESERRLLLSQNRRTIQMGRIGRELAKRNLDEAVRRKRGLHTDLLKRYAPLRFMMDLLKLRSAQARQSFTATVIESRRTENASMGTGFAGFNETEPRGANLSILLVDSALDSLEKGSQIQLCSTGQRPLRPKAVIGIERLGDRVTLEVNMRAGAFAVGDQLEGVLVPRFRMWAHQKAVALLFDDGVDGHWTDLAEMLCHPSESKGADKATLPNAFFCDGDANRPSLNLLQREAVAGALATQDFYCIQGPPGTGKTAVICELVQQLTGNGERVLVASTTHVAVNEVLRRIGSAEGVRALRLTADESKAEGVERYLPSQIIDKFVERAFQQDSHAVERKNQQSRIKGGILLLDRLERCQRESASARESATGAGGAKRRAEKRLAAEKPALTLKVRVLPGEIAEMGRSVDDRRRELCRAEVEHNDTTKNASRWELMSGKLGLGEISRTNRIRSRCATSLTTDEEHLELLQRELRISKDHLKSLRATILDAEAALTRAVARQEESQTAEAECRRACERDPSLGPVSLKMPSDEKRQELLDHGERLSKHQILRHRFDELVREATRNGEDLDALREDLLSVTNLFCCTTTGIAGSPQLKDVVVDTFIVDEASRLIDSEFLIGAVRAKRWILIGDEHQLPPFVEQRDEYFIHALSALYKSDGEAVNLDGAVDELGEWWDEDEDLHRFRSGEVLKVAVALHDSGDWESVYRSAFREGIRPLQSVNTDPARQLLTSMRDHLVHSLFERVVTSCQDSKRARLIEQRRMIAPIAEIVRGPIYAGEYETPPAESTGILPLTTRTFRKPITFLDTTLHGIKAKNTLEGDGFINKFEADWIVWACEAMDRDLADEGSDAVTVSILCFYQAQASRVDARLKKLRFTRLTNITCRAIDGMQGQEADIVIVGFCRTSYAKRVGPNFGRWLQDIRRLNVACTRARRALIFVGQKALLMKLCSDNRAREFYENLDQLFTDCPSTMQEIREFKASR